MSLGADLTRLVAGLLIGMLLPRIPLLFFTRFIEMERDLAPHPDPIPIGIPLVQRMLLMRRVHGMCWIVAIFPLALGLVILRSSPEPFAMGMVAGVSWFMLSRMIPQDANRGFSILPMSLIQEINNLREPESVCCKEHFLQWEVRAVRCRHCRSVATPQPRPDLGRTRSDGRLMGSLRILLMDGNPVFPVMQDSVVVQGVELLGEVTEEE